ncbi:UDP-N-acetyl-D-galactosamine dehydrogenase [Cognatiyoonia koreensis]|uniref:UDP-N-acetyl-D-galactosamine dehydrogenase n=1 Tax=Cognatiyoonia koreensis TaxID=364200 RepID=A0A1I0RQL0_9RHOB|nr:nucleotide sugar dehydrogenase [Cognatiyoonia koreensis]SEW43518.1 UDP-N-acetyl-D-galactosamine dehydrogenase [Cognatiyoonia koreensis]
MTLLLDGLAHDQKETVLRYLPTREKDQSESIAVVGLGYVGLPLATSLAQKFKSVVGYDVSEKRVSALCRGRDHTKEVAHDTLMTCGLDLTTDDAALADATFYIVTVPTPITKTHQPDLAPLQAACRMIGQWLSPGDIVVFESTVYPGLTEDFCGPILEEYSDMKAGRDFFLGYSPERINPGDPNNTVDKITKIVSGDTPASLARIKAVYHKIIDAGLHVCPSIKVAEGAKVLENTQRDVNIALMNEMSLICDKLGISTFDVIDAAATKWNFVPFTPGLVGGHCIGVDPYYLASAAEQVGLHPQVILAGRRLNDAMAEHVTQAAVRLLIQTKGAGRDARIGVFGMTFKENVPDARNSKAVEVVQRLRAFGFDPMVHDPVCSKRDAAAVDIALCNKAEMRRLDVLILTTPHDAYAKESNFLDRLKPGGALIDVRGVFAKEAATRGLRYWSL